jgi:ATP-dependent DNA ligase
LVGQFEFVEWTGENHLRHTRFIALRDDKKATDVRRESENFCAVAFGSTLYGPGVIFSNG